MAERLAGRPFRRPAIDRPLSDCRYGTADWICSIVYLTDVDETTPAFAVAPKTVT